MTLHLSLRHFNCWSGAFEINLHEICSFFASVPIQSHGAHTMIYVMTMFHKNCRDSAKKKTKRVTKMKVNLFNSIFNWIKKGPPSEKGSSPFSSSNSEPKMKQKNETWVVENELHCIIQCHTESRAIKRIPINWGCHLVLLLTTVLKWFTICLLTCPDFVWNNASNALSSSHTIALFHIVSDKNVEIFFLHSVLWWMCYSYRLPGLNLKWYGMC